VIVIPGINPEPWKVGPASAIRTGGGKLAASIAPDPGLQVYQEALKEEFRLLGVPLLAPNYHLRFWWWRQLETYRGPKRMVTRNAVDQTNLQKAAEDAMQPSKEGRNRSQFDGIITNDRYCVFSGGTIMEQSKTAEPLIVIEILSGFGDPDTVLPAEITDLAADAIEKALSANKSTHEYMEIP